MEIIQPRDYPLPLLEGDDYQNQSHDLSFKTPTPLPTPLQLEFDLRKFYVAEPKQLECSDPDPQLIEAYQRIQELENENRLLKAAQCQKCSHTICDITDPLEGLMSQVNFLKDQYLELRKEYEEYRARHPPIAKTLGSWSNQVKTPALSISETTSYSSISSNASSTASSPHTSLAKVRSIDAWREQSSRESHSPPLDELTLVDEGEELSDRELLIHSRKTSSTLPPTRLASNRANSQHKVRSFHYSKAFIKLLGVDPFNRPISTTNSSNSSFDYSDICHLSTRSWCLPPPNSRKNGARRPPGVAGTRSVLMHEDAKRYSGLWDLKQPQSLSEAN